MVLTNRNIPRVLCMHLGLWHVACVYIVKPTMRFKYPLLIAIYTVPQKKRYKVVHCIIL